MIRLSLKILEKGLSFFKPARYILQVRQLTINKRLSPRKTRGPESKVGKLAARMRF